MFAACTQNSPSVGDDAEGARGWGGGGGGGLLAVRPDYGHAQFQYIFANFKS